MALGPTNSYLLAFLDMSSFPPHFNLFEDRNDDFIVLLSSVHFTVFATQLAPSSGLENIYHFEDYKAMKERNFAIF